MRASAAFVVMSTPTNILTDSSWLSRADQGLGKIESALAALGGASIFLAMLISVVNILGRKLLNMPIPGYVAVMQQLVPLMAFFGIAFCQRVGNHIRMDILVGRLEGRLLWVFEWFSVLLAGLLTTALIYGSWDHALRAFTLGDTTDDLQIPTWPVKVVVPIMLSMLLVRLVLQLLAYSRAVQHGGDQPVAVPLIEDPEAVAKNEANTALSMSKD